MVKDWNKNKYSNLKMDDKNIKGRKEKEVTYFNILTFASYHSDFFLQRKKTKLWWN